MPSCMAPVSLLSTYIPPPWAYWLGFSSFRLILSCSCSPQILPHFGNGRGFHRTRCRTLVCWCLSPKRKFLNVRATNEYVGHNSSSEGHHTLKKNYLHTDSWPYNWALLKVHIQHIFHCSEEELASTTLKGTIYSVSCYFCKNCLISPSKCQNEVE